MNSILAAISGQGLIQSLIVLLVIGIVLWLLHYLIAKSPIPEPFKTVLTWLVIAAGVIFLINFLLGLIGKGFIVF